MNVFTYIERTLLSANIFWSYPLSIDSQYLQAINFIVFYSSSYSDKQEMKLWTHSWKSILPYG